MKSSIKPFVVSILLLAQALVIPVTPALAAAPHQTSSDLLEPVVVESCPGFSPFDAAVVLQETINQYNSHLSQCEQCTKIAAGGLYENILKLVDRRG